jgi:hypothetical protein
VPKTKANRTGWVLSLGIIGIGLLGIPLVQDAPDETASTWAYVIWAGVVALTATTLLTSAGVASRTIAAAALLIAISSAVAVDYAYSSATNDIAASIRTAQLPFLAIVGLLGGLSALLNRPPSGDSDEPDGLRGPKPVPNDVDSSLAAMLHYLDWWEKDYARARRVVKKRAALVTIWTNVLTGIVAVLGAISAALSNDPWMDLAAILTTAASATTAVLFAWNEHFHHKELWIQRSRVLSELQSLRREYESLSRQKQRRRSQDRLAKRLRTELRTVLGEDLQTWTSIQSGG